MYHSVPHVNPFGPHPATLDHFFRAAANRVRSLTVEAPIVIVGMGEMGGVFGRALLTAGHPVFPVGRGDDMAREADAIPEPALALVTVGEDDLHGVLATLPEAWRSRVGLIQNELLPRDWEEHGIDEPTVAAVWFEKKPGKPVTVIVPTPVAGPASSLLVDALGVIDIAATAIDEYDLVDALVAKNLYILTANIAGLSTGGTVSDVWSNRELADAVVDEVLAVQEYLVGSPIDRDRAVTAMVEAFAADPDHGATGRSASRRLERAIGHAESAGIEVPTLRAIARETEA